MESELMTGFLDKNGSNPLSRVTIAGLDDLGYTVDYATADTYTKSNLNTDCQCNKSSGRLRSVLDMSDKGTAHQFGVKSSSSRQRRRISDEAYQIAMNYGLSILQERAETMKVVSSSVVINGNGNTSGNTAPVTRYIGDQIVSVLVEDDGEIYGVMVINQ
jgi:hypothetical protein